MGDVQLTQAEVGQNTASLLTSHTLLAGQADLTEVKSSTLGVSSKYYHYGATEHFLLINKGNVRAAAVLPSSRCVHSSA